MNKIYEITSMQNSMISDVKTVFQKILEAAYTSNDVARNVEHEIAYQRDITDSAKNAIDAIVIMNGHANDLSCCE